MTTERGWRASRPSTAISSRSPSLRKTCKELREGTDDRAEALPTVPCEADTPDCGSNLSDTRRPVLGEVMGTGVRTFADTLNAPVADVASVLGHEKAGSLRRMID